MGDREAFIAGIAAEPDEDLPRLAFADWLDENGDADRATFIRLQCAMTRAARVEPVGYPGAGPDWSHNDVLWFFSARWVGWVQDFCRAVGFDLLDRSPPRPRRSWGDWLRRRPRTHRRPPTARLAEFGRGRALIEVWEPAPLLWFEFDRGLVGSIDLSMAHPHPAPTLPEAFRMEPVSQLTLHVGPDRGYWAAVDGPHLGQVRRLSLALPTDPRGVVPVFDAIVHSRHWSGVRELTVWCPARDQWGGHGPPPTVPREYLDALIRSPLLGGRVATLPVGPAGLEALAAGAAGLRGVRLWQSNLGPAAGRILPRAVFRDTLEVLDLFGNGLGDAGVRALFGGEDWPGLRVLNLGFNHVEDAGMAALHPLAGRLTALHVDRNRLTDSGALALAAALNPAGLRELSIGGNSLSEGATRTLRDRFGDRVTFEYTVYGEYAADRFTRNEHLRFTT